MHEIKNELLRGINDLPQRLRTFIKATVINDFRRSGVVLGVSGGVDSAVTLRLCAEALGEKKVQALIMPDKESSPVSNRLGKKVCDQQGVHYEEVPITPILEALGIYSMKDALIRRVFPQYDPSVHKTSLTLPADALHSESLNIPQLKLVQDNKVIEVKRLNAKEYLEIVGLQNVKQRSRMLVQYMFAEKMDYAVCGTSNKTEMLTGFCVKYGDGGADLKPLGDCYKTQVYAIARLLAIDEEVIGRAPSPDTWSHYVTDEDFYWRMSHDILDQLLYAQEHGLSVDEIAESTQLDKDEIGRAFRHISNMQKTARFVLMSPPIFKMDPKTPEL